MKGIFMCGGEGNTENSVGRKADPEGLASSEALGKKRWGWMCSEWTPVDFLSETIAGSESLARSENPRFS